jgi:hypothetical protein
MTLHPCPQCHKPPEEFREHLGIVTLYWVVCGNCYDVDGDSMGYYPNEFASYSRVSHDDATKTWNEWVEEQRQ